MWPAAAPGPKADRYNVGYNPQYLLTVDVPRGSNDSAVEVRGGQAFTEKRQASIWILLTRHITMTETDTQRRNKEGRMIVQEEKDQDFMTLHIYRLPSVAATEEEYDAARERKGDDEPIVLEPTAVASERVYFPGDAMINGVYSNNQHVLTRFDLPPGKHDLVLVVSQLQRTKDMEYTMETYSMAPITLRPVRDEFPHRSYVVGKCICRGVQGRCGNSWVLVG